jgi:CRISPR-associated protein Csx17
MTVRERLRALDDLSTTSQKLARAGEEARKGKEGPERRHSLVLEGCRPTPLAFYLKALGILRLVAEQADREARGSWKKDRFVLETTLDRNELRQFFLETYRPTPIVAPWNGGSGFFPGDNLSGITPLEKSTASRLEAIRRTIGSGRAALAEIGLTKKPDKKEKIRLLTRLRATIDETVLPWMDAAVLLTEEDPRYPPLLGTGGNDGRLEFTNNYLQRIVELFDVDSGAPTSQARLQLGAALHEVPIPELEDSAIGQFAPGAAGGPNAASSFVGSAQVNGWDFVLMLEGALLFSASATRRLEAEGRVGLSYPFTVGATASGTGAADFSDEEASRGEIWLPLWKRPATLNEVKMLLGEGRATVGRRNARDGLDFARAVASFGVGRGISEFQRIGFLQRFGRTFLATPLNRIPVRRNVTAGLIDQLERREWLSRFRRLARRKEAPARLTSLVRRLENALFNLALRGDASPRYAQEVLSVLGESLHYFAQSPAGRERCGPPPRLDESWVIAADDESSEYQLALALAGLHARSGQSGSAPQLPMVAHMAPVAQDRRERWNEDARHDVVWGHRSLEENLHLVLERRLLAAEEMDLSDLPLDAWTPAPLSAVAAWLEGQLDTDRIQALLPGLTLTRSPHNLDSSPFAGSRPPVPAAFRVLKPFFCTHGQLVRTGILDRDGRVPLTKEMVRALAADRTSDVIRQATRRLRIVGHTLPTTLKGEWAPGRRLLATLMVPIRDRDLRQLMEFLQPRQDPRDS